MYRIMVNGNTFCTSRADDLAVINPVVELEANSAGTFTMTIPPTHPYYDLIETRKSIIDVMQNDTVLFEGVCVSQTVDFYKQKTIICEGELTYFNDSIQRPARFQNVSVRGLLTSYIGNHNAQMDSTKQFEVGAVTVNDPNDSIYCYTNYDSTMESLAGDLTEDYGGYFRIRHEDYFLVDNNGNRIIVFDGNETAFLGWGQRVIDYLAESPRTNTQTIRIGKNLMDLTEESGTDETVTVVIPLGCQLEESEVEGLDARLTIASVNDGKDFIEDTEAIATYGRITKVVTWDDVTTAEALKRKAEEYLAENKFEKMVINATAFDLSLSEDDFMDFQLLDNVRVVSEPHGLDRCFMITKIIYNLDAPQNNQLTLGTEIKASISAKTAKASGTGKTSLIGTFKTDFLEVAKANATMIMENGGKGYVYFDYDDNAVIRSIMIMDTQDPLTATKRWVWNENGFGYASRASISDSWKYKTAMTMDGQIVADFITSGTLVAQNGNYEINTQTGKIKMKDAEITGGTINMRSSSASYDAISLNYEDGDGKRSSIIISPGFVNQFYPTGNAMLGLGTYRCTYENETMNLSTSSVQFSDSSSTKSRGQLGNYFLTFFENDNKPRVTLNKYGLTFYDANGKVTKTYSAT